MKKEKPTIKAFTEKFTPTAEFYSQIIDNLQDYAIFTTDKDLRINSWNAGSAKIFGYETQEVMGRHCELIFTDEDRKNDVPKLRIESALKEGKTSDQRWHLCKDGRTFFAYGLIFPLKNNEGELLGFIKILRDLTEKKKSEEAIKKYIKELEEINTHKESIIAILSHDLRTPLAGIIQMAELLKKDYKNMSEDELQRMLDTQYDLATKELNMLDYLLEWARIKLAWEFFTPQQIDLETCVKKVFDTLNEIAVQNTIQLNYKINENTRVFADEKMLLSILQNLVSNAIRHSIKGGEVTITAREKDDMIQVQVKDTGEGMSKSIQEKLFTPQLKTLLQEREVDKGGGIGLLLVKSFLDRSGGEIWVESEEGKGASFYFTLPIENPLDKMDSADKLVFDESA